MKNIDFQELNQYLEFAEEQMKYILSDYEYDEGLILEDEGYEKKKQQRSELYTEFDLDPTTITELKSIIQKAVAYIRAADKPMSTTKKTHFIIGDKEEGKEEVVGAGIEQDSESQLFMRGPHLEEVANIAEFVARRLGLNPDLALLTGLVHDIGHTWSGHSGERVLNSIANLEDCGYILHNAMGAYILEREKIVQKAEESIRQLYPDENIKEFRRLIRYMIDGMVCHNGEGTVGKIIPDFSKTDRQMQEELKRCFTEKGADKKIMPATMEGAIIRYADIIAYIRSDIVNAFRMKEENGKKVFTGFDDDYLAIIGTLLAKELNNTQFLSLETKLLRDIYYTKQEIVRLEEMEQTNDSLLTPEEIKAKKEERKSELEKLEEKYSRFEKVKVEYARVYVNTLERDDKKQVKERVPQFMQNVFKKDLVEYSKGKSIISMSPLIRTMFFKLRSINVSKIVSVSRKKYETDKLPQAVKGLIDSFAESLIKSGVAYEILPKDVKGQIESRFSKIDQDETRKQLEKEPKTNLERKVYHYYLGLINSDLVNNIYENASISISNIAAYDVDIAIAQMDAEKDGEGKAEYKSYDGDFKDEYQTQKIDKIKELIKKYMQDKNVKTIQELTDEHKAGIIYQIATEKQKDIERILAYKMAIEYVGGMTDTTILNELLKRGLLSIKDLQEADKRYDMNKSKGQGKTPQEENHVKNLQNKFNSYEGMIIE